MASVFYNYRNIDYEVWTHEFQYQGTNFLSLSLSAIKILNPETKLRVTNLHFLLTEDLELHLNWDTYDYDGDIKKCEKPLIILEAYNNNSIIITEKLKNYTLAFLNRSDEFKGLLQNIDLKQLYDDFRFELLLEG